MISEALITELKLWESNTIYKVSFECLSKYDLESINQSVQSDYFRYYGNHFDINKIKYFPGLIASTCYRFARRFYLNSDEDQALEISSLGRFYTGIELYFSADIGHSLKINHGSGTVVGARSIIGNNALLHHLVTLGEKNGRPKIGDNIVIYPGAKILGSVILGNNVVVGADSLVLDNFGDNSILAGSPAKNIKK